MATASALLLLALALSVVSAMPPQHTQVRPSCRLDSSRAMPVSHASPHTCNATPDTNHAALDVCNATPDTYHAVSHTLGDVVWTIGGSRILGMPAVQIRSRSDVLLKDPR